MSKRDPKPPGEKKPAKIWERWPHEPPEAYAAALVYFTMPDRTVAGAWSEYARRSGAAAPDGDAARERDRKTATRWKWADRAEAFDAERARLEASEVDRAARRKAAQWAERYQRAREDDYDIAQALRHKALEMLATPLYQETVTEVDPTTGAAVTVVREPAKWRASDIPAYLRAATELQEGAFRAVMPNTESNQAPAPAEAPEPAGFNPPTIIDVVRHPPRVLPGVDASPRRVIEASYRDETEAVDG